VTDEEVHELVEQAQEVEPGEAEGKMSAVDRLLAIGHEAELFHDEFKVPFARFLVSGHNETWPVESLAFRGWLRREFFTRFKKAAPAKAMTDALGVLIALAQFDGPERPISIRVAQFEGAIWYDLCDAEWRAVRIDASGWEVVDHPPPLFRRYSHMAPQAVPVRGSDPKKLFESLNVTERDQPLMLAWTVAAYVPDIPHPIPDFHGEKGAGKSVGQRVLRSLIDPSHVETLPLGGNQTELIQLLAHHYCPVFDNVDYISPQLSDLLCRAVTGEGQSKRKLYTDDDDVIYSFRRVMLINGVNIIAQRPDLLDRSILIELARIDPLQRRDERQLWTEFEQSKPTLLGALFDLLVGAIARRDGIHLDTLPRMADFALWGAAVAEAQGLGARAFAFAYEQNRERQTREAVDSDLVGAAVLAFMRDNSVWTGTPTALLDELQCVADEERLITLNTYNKRKVDNRFWPQNPSQLTKRLNNLRSNLRDLGIEVEYHRGNERTVTLRMSEPGPESPVGGVGPDGEFDIRGVIRPSGEVQAVFGDDPAATEEGQQWTL
jgi:hypothetical protein